jgi:plastocyanin
MINRLISILMILMIFLNHPIEVLGAYTQEAELIKHQTGWFGFFLSNINSNPEDSPKYLLKGSKGDLWVSKDSIWLSMRESLPESKKSTSNGIFSAKGINIKFSFPDSNPRVELIAEEMMDGHASLLYGNDPGSWVTEIPIYQSIRYQNIYPGVDFLIRSSDTGFEWAFEVKDESINHDLQLEVQGIESILEDASAITLQTDLFDVEIPNISLLGITNEIKNLSSITNFTQDGKFFLYPLVENTNEFELEANSDLIYSSFLGGGNWDTAYDVSVDTNNDIYIVGTTASSDFPTTIGAFDTTLDQTEVFITKYTSSNNLVYATFLGGSSQETGWEVEARDGFAYVVGETWSVNFPVSDSLNVHAGETDAFVVKLNQSGTGLVYSRLIGGEDQDKGYSIDVQNGNAYITGSTESIYFPGGGYYANGDIFGVKLHTDGTIDYSRVAGGRWQDAGFSISVKDGIAWITGETWSDNFATGYTSNSDIFVMSISSTGNVLTKRAYGGSAEDYGTGIVIDGLGVPIITGSTKSNNIAGMNNTFQGVEDSYLIKINLSNSGIAYGSYLGGSGKDKANSINIDEMGGIVVAGLTQSSDFPVTPDAFQIIMSGSSDGFVTRYSFIEGYSDPITYSSFLGGNNFDEIQAVSMDDTRKAVLVGVTFSADFPVTSDALYSTLNGTQDAFLSVLAVGPLPMISIQKSTNEVDADQPPGPYMYPGTPITWRYQVENLGEVPLTEVTVSDNKLGIITCPKNSLIAGESMTCNVTGSAVANQYSNMGTVTAITPYDTVIGDTDASHYFGAVPETTLVKKTNDVVVSQPSDLYIEEAGNITWTYEVYNTGNVDLTNVSVVDDNGTTGETGDDQTVCTIELLPANATQPTICSLSGNAVLGPYSNIAVVVGTPPGGLADVSDEDVSHYFGSAPGISLVKKLDGNVTSTPGPYLLKDTAITWTYEVTNTGNVDLTNVTVVDDNGTPADPFDDRTACTGLTIAAGATNISSCLLSDTVKLGSYHNIATVTGTPPVGTNVTATADGYYYGANPVVEIEYSVNTDIADSSPGLYVYTGSNLNLSYLITNSGNVDLSGIAVTDVAGNTITCPFTSLPAGNSMTCSASMTALSGQQSVMATVTATPPSPLVNIQASDPIYYFGSSPSLSLDKKTNGQQGDSIPGVYVKAGSTVNWTYFVKNTGNVTLTGVTVLDDNGTPANLADDQIPTGCNNITLTPSQEVNCTLSGTAIVGQYTNVAAASGNPPSPLTSVTVNDTSHYFGATLSITLDKQTNGQDAANAPGPLIAVDGYVNWTYAINNDSNVPVTFSIVDTPAVTISCDKNSLAAGEDITCTASGSASAGQYSNTATVTATPPGGLAPFGASDTSHYFGVITGVELIKSTNGQDANTAPGPFIKIGDPVTWTYQVTNTGNVELNNVSVTDDKGVAITCDDTTLAPQASMTCTASGTAVAGQYANIGSVKADPPTGFSLVSDSDPSHYFGGDASINIEKFTNGDDNSAAPGIYILVGQTVTWTYTVSNTGNVALENVVVRDDRGTETLTDDYNCVIGSLAVGAEDTTTCSTSDIAEAGQYANTAYVSGDVVNMDGQVFDQDFSFYFGADPGIQIIKKVNGEDANEPPGPYIPVGETVNFSYVISYVGDPYQLTSIEITDESGVIPTCPFDQLTGGKILTCEGQGAAGTGQQSDVVYVSATTWLNDDEPLELGVVTASDISHYFGYTLGIDVEKYTNGADVSDPPGVELPIDSQVTWTYEVTNTSNVAINSVTVTDDQEGLIGCPKESLASSETMTCSATGVVMGGQYSNEATVNAEFEVNTEVTETLMDTDRSYYHGIPAFKVFIPLLMR